MEQKKNPHVFFSAPVTINLDHQWPVVSFSKKADQRYFTLHLYCSVPQIVS